MRGPRCWKLLLGNQEIAVSELNGNLSVQKQIQLNSSAACAGLDCFCLALNKTTQFHADIFHVLF